MSRLSVVRVFAAFFPFASSAVERGRGFKVEGESAVSRRRLVCSSLGFVGLGSIWGRVPADVVWSISPARRGGVSFLAPASL